MSGRLLAVLGHPIAHSLSPALHTAAYETLGLDWTYSAVDIEPGALAAHVDSLGHEWRGLSLTMPFKREALPLVDELDEVAALTGAVNTLLISGEPRSRQLRGFNTDVRGIELAVGPALAGVEPGFSVRILGAGATAASVIVAAKRLGAGHVEILARSVERARDLVPLLERLGMPHLIADFAHHDPANPPALVVSTLPGGTDGGHQPTAEVIANSVLFDVTYDPWPTSLATAWLRGGGTVVPGIELLINQAVLQVRIFVSGSVETPLPDEDAVTAAMRAAVA